jgi:hypothetical protein
MDFTFSEHHDLLRQERARVRQERRSCRTRAQVGREGALPEGARAEARRARPARHPHPRGVRRLGHGHDELRDLRRGDRAHRRLAALTVASHNGLGTGHILAFGNEAQKKKYLPKAAEGRVARGVGAHRAGLRAATRRACARRPAATANGGCSTARRCSSRRAASAASASSSRVTNPSFARSGITAFIVEHGTKGFSASPHLEKLGCVPATPASSPSRTCVSPTRTASASSTRLHRHDEDPRPRARLHRRAGARPRLRRPRRGRHVREGPEAVRQGHRRVPGHSVDARRHETELDAASLLDYRAAGWPTHGSPTRGGLDGEALRERGGARARATARSRSTAATATRASSPSSATSATRSSARSARARAKFSASSSRSTCSRADATLESHRAEPRRHQCRSASPPPHALAVRRPRRSGWTLRSTVTRAVPFSSPRGALWSPVMPRALRSVTLALCTCASKAKLKMRFVRHRAELRASASGHGFSGGKDLNMALSVP